MIDALLEGRKIQTRRIIKPQPMSGSELKYVGEMGVDSKTTGFTALFHDPKDSWLAPDKPTGMDVKSPYGKVGDYLWVRENFMLQKTYNHLPPTQWEGSLVGYSAGGGANVYGKTRPSIHMPRWASRLTLKITDIRVERLQDISEEDCFKEGINCRETQLADTGDSEYFCQDYSVDISDNSRYPWFSEGEYKSFKTLWQSINGYDSWKTNPWVWVIEFETTKKNIDEVIK